MKTEYFPVITPDEGMMLYNPTSNVYSDKVYVGKLDSVDNWQEVPVAQYEAWVEAQRIAAEEAEKALIAEAEAQMANN